MQSVVVLLAVFCCCSLVISEPTKPKRILISGTVQFNTTNSIQPDRYRITVAYIDTEKQIIRDDSISDNTGEITIANYISQTEYVIKTVTQVPTMNISCYTTRTSTENPFEKDMFASAKYAGLSAFNGHIVNVWENVFLWSPYPSTVYMDAFTGIVAGTFSKDSFSSSTSVISVISTKTPDTSYFQVPEELHCHRRPPQH